MTYAMRYIRSFVMVALCMNSVFVVASEYRSFPVYPIPRTHAGFNGEWGSGVRLGAQNIFSFVDYKMASKIIAATMVFVVVFYVYKTKYCSKELQKAGGVVEREIDTYIGRMKGTVDSYIDKLLLPEMIKSYIKESISQSIAEHIAHARGSVKRYYDNNKRYFISILAIPGGIFLGWPVTGGIVGTTGILLGAIQSIREEMAVFRKENEEFHKRAHEQVAKGFEKVATDIAEIQTKIGELGEGLGGKIENVSLQLTDINDSIVTVKQQLSLFEGQIDTHQQETKQLLEKTNKQLLKVQEGFGILLLDVQKTASETKEQLNSMKQQQDSNAKESNQKIAELLETVQNLTISNKQQIEELYRKIDKKIESLSEELTEVKSGLVEVQKTNQQISDLIHNLNPKVEDVFVVVERLEEHATNARLLQEEENKTTKEALENLNKKSDITNADLESIIGIQTKHNKEQIEIADAIFMGNLALEELTKTVVDQDNNIKERLEKNHQECKSLFQETIKSQDCFSQNMSNFFTKFEEKLTHVENRVDKNDEEIANLRRDNLLLQQQLKEMSVVIQSSENKFNLLEAGQNTINEKLDRILSVTEQFNNNSCNKRQSLNNRSSALVNQEHPANNGDNNYNTSSYGSVCELQNNYSIDDFKKQMLQLEIKKPLTY